MALDANLVQPNAVVSFNGNNETVVSIQNDVVTVGNHENGEVKQYYLSYLLEHGDPVRETLAEENSEAEPVNPSGYDPVTGKPNPPSATPPIGGTPPPVGTPPSGVTPVSSPSGPFPTPNNPASSSAPDSPRANNPTGA